MAETLNISHIQLFRLKRKTLEKRLTNYYEETGDGEKVMRYLTGLQVRDELTGDDFSWMLKDLVRHIFLKTKTTRTMRSLFQYYKEYFSAGEFRMLVKRFFSPAQQVLAEMTELPKKMVNLLKRAFRLRDGRFVENAGPDREGSQNKGNS